MKADWHFYSCETHQAQVRSNLPDDPTPPCQSALPISFPACYQRRRLHVSSFSLPPVSIIVCLCGEPISTLSLQTLNLTMELVEWTLNTIDKIFSTRKLGSGEPAQFERCLPIWIHDNRAFADRAGHRYCVSKN